MSCGTDGLLRIMRDSKMIWGLSSCVHHWVANPGPQTEAPYIREGVTSVSKSHPFVRGFWKCAWWHRRSSMARDVYPHVSLYLAVGPMVNRATTVEKVTPR